ncbi:MAG: hypothetical protein CW345_02600 [Firmicutes bacterium]|nr:hypothetical protein [Bacillota bacterium]MBO2520686.1 hypothetical protein [Bacillota bacterium]
MERETFKAWLSRWRARAGEGAAAGGLGPQARGMAVLILLGALLMVLGGRMGEDAAVPSGGPPPGDRAVPALADSGRTAGQLERDVAALLSQVAGAGSVEVLIVPATSEVLVFAEEVTERRSVTRGQPSAESGRPESVDEQVTRRPVLYRSQDGRSEQALVRYHQRPRIAGVLVAAEGAGDPAVRLKILEAVATALDVPVHRVHVVEKR